jgi:hypothetical protein
MRLRNAVFALVMLSVVLVNAPAGAQVVTTDKSGSGSFTSNACHVLTYLSVAGSVNDLRKAVSDTDDSPLRIVLPVLSIIGTLSGLCSNPTIVSNSNRQRNQLKRAFRNIVPKKLPTLPEVDVGVPSVTFLLADKNDMIVKWIQTSTLTANIQVDWKYDNTSVWFDAGTYAFGPGDLEDQVSRILVLNPCSGIEAAIRADDGPWLYSFVFYPESQYC